MIGTLAEMPRELSADVCIIGAGAAGITLARQLARRLIDVVLCEAGGLEMSDHSQSVYEGEVDGEDYFALDEARLRYFGGTTNQWHGWCRHLDAADFDNKVSGSPTSWPIAKTDLDPYFQEAREVLGAAAVRPDETLGRSGLKRIDLGLSSPVGFADRHHAELDGSARARVILNANLVSARARDHVIEAIRVRDYDDNERDIRARFFVIACGGIENSRLLLWMSETGDLPFAQGSRLIGRYWMEHPHAPVGSVVIGDKNRFRFDENGLDFFSPTPEFMRENGTLNARLSLGAADHDGAGEVIADLLCAAPAYGKWIMHQFGQRLACVAQLKAAWEQEPVFHNAVSLGDERDRFGIPRCRLHWTRSRLDHRTIAQAAVAFAGHLAEQNIGRVKLDDWLLDPDAGFAETDEMAGFHHMGGTRMAASATAGVVDADCRIFGTKNFYVAGSSVFPSGGHANPTFPIVQLSLRLADHLARHLPHAS
jgi:choline dehydrogenase-like flavoprotein